MIEIEGLSKQYAPDVFALDDVTLQRRKRGEFGFLTGPSGAGKTTLLRILLRQELPTARPHRSSAGATSSTLSRRQVQAYRRTVGFVFQDFKLIPRKTVFENVIFALRILGVPDVQQRRAHLPGAEVGRPAASSQRLPAASCRAASSSGWPSRARS